jgi:hypothetical protein
MVIFEMNPIWLGRAECLGVRKALIVPACTHLYSVIYPQYYAHM